jgi:hypothetical protein
MEHIHIHRRIYAVKNIDTFDTIYIKYLFLLKKVGDKTESTFDKKKHITN